MDATLGLGGWSAFGGDIGALCDRRPCASEVETMLSEDGGPIKMQVPEIQSPHRVNEGTFKLHVELKTYCGSTPKMNGTRKKNVQQVVRAISVCVRQGREG